MYEIKKMPYGYKLTFGGFIKVDEMGKWVEESKKNLIGQAPGFGIFVDMRDLRPLPQDAQKVMIDGQGMYKKAGMQRSVVILANPLTTMQFQRLAKESGIYQWERYIDASTVPNWETVGIGWVSKGIDPDKK